METDKFSVVMSEKVDMELVRIMTSECADYQPEAVIAAASSFICVGKSDSLSFPFSIVACYRVGSYIVWLSNMW